MDIKKCDKCGMIRAKKDVVLLNDGSYICFSCWNKHHKNNFKKEDK